MVLLLISLPGLAEAGQKKKPTPKPTPTDQQSSQTEPLVPLTDQQAVDEAITEMLGGWQIGDITLMKKYYADDVLVVSGVWEPPLQGWERYLQAYMRQRERMRSVQLNRQNTYIRVQGTVGWAVYQWSFTAEVEGQLVAYYGQTTLVFEKRNGRWQIVTNHTSVANSPQQQQQPPQKPAVQTPPGKPGS
jgi:ketosteroid isomerase-like protein